MADLRRVSVFISSPADVMAERALAERAVARIHDAWKAYVRLEAVRWERGHYEAAKGFQESIGEMTAFDVVIGIVWKRVGSALRPDLFQRADGTAYESGTVFELESAIACSESRGTPSVYLFRKTEPITYTAEGVDEERRQFEGLNRWWNRLVRDEAGHFVRGYQEFATPDELERRIEALIESYLREKGLIPAGPAWDIDARGSPFPGLLPYDSEYAEVFFGRSLAAAAALEELKAAAGRETPVVFVVGPSGSGKSSLARAGLAPLLAGKQIKGVDFWRKLLAEPAANPLISLAQRLYSEDALPELAGSPMPTPDSFAALARSAPESAAAAVKWALDRAAQAEHERIGGGRLPTGRLLVVLDQLESVLDGDDKAALTGFLRRLIESETTWMVATLRSDRYADLQLDPDLIELRRRGAMFDLPPPGPSEIADIIKGPARAADLVFEEREGVSLAKTINADVHGADALPLLQMTLARLFDARDGRTLTFAAYEGMGGLEGAIAAHAEAVFEQVSAAGQAALDGLLRALVADVDEGGALTIRTPALAAVAADEPARELVERLMRGRLLVNAEGSVRIAHEALLRRWQRATRSPALQPEAIRLRHQIEPNFQVWRKTERAADLLQPGTTAITAAQAITREYPGALPPELEDYVRRSIEAATAAEQAKQARALAEARRTRRRAYAAMVAAAAFAGLAVLAFLTYRDAQANFSLALLTKSEQLLRGEHPTRARVLATAATGASVLPGFIERAITPAAQRDKDIRARTIAGIAAPASQAPVASLMLPYPAVAVAFSADRKRYAVGDESGQVVVAALDAAGPRFRLRGHQGSISSVRFSPSGRWLTTASADRTIRLWNTESGEKRALCEHTGQVTDLAFDPHGRYLASAARDGRVIVRDAASLETIKDLSLRRDDARGRGWALAVEFSHDGERLAASDDDGNVFVHRIADWTTQRVATGRSDLVSLAFSADDKRIATASIDGSLDVWETATGRHLKAIDEYRNKLWKVRFSPDGRFLAAASWDGTVRLWQAQTYRYAGTIDGNDHWITDLAFAADSAELLTASQSGAVRRWHTQGIAPMFHTVADNERETLVGRYNADGTRFATGGRDRTARLYAVDRDGGLALLCAVPHADWVVSVNFSPDGRAVVSAGTKDGRPDNAIRIWDADDCRTLKTIDVGNAFVQRVVYAPDGRSLAWSNPAGEIWLEALGPKPQRTRLPPRHAGVVYALDFSPDGKLLASAGRDAKVVVWNVESQTVERELHGHQQPVTALRFAPDGRRLASSGSDYEVMVWNLDQPNAPAARLPVRGGASGALAFSPDGALLASGSDARYISIWALASGEKVFQLDALVGVRGVFGFHPTRGDLAFDGENGIVRILPKNHTPPVGANQIAATLQGTDVFFDHGKSTYGSAGGDVIESPAKACVP